MSLFEKEIEVPITQSFSVKSASQIYVLFKSGKDCSQMFKEDRVPMEDSVLVFNEMSRIESVVLANISTVNNIDALVSSISSSLLDVRTVVNDIIAYDPTYRLERTFDEFKVYYTQQ